MTSEYIEIKVEATIRVRKTSLGEYGAEAIDHLQDAVVLAMTEPNDPDGEDMMLDATVEGFKFEVTP